MVDYVAIAFLREAPYTIKKLTELSSIETQSKDRRKAKYSAWLADSYPDLWIECEIVIVRKYDLRNYIYKHGPNHYTFKIIYYKLHGDGIKKGRASSKYVGKKEGEKISECSKCGTQLLDYISPTGQVLHSVGDRPITDNPLFKHLGTPLDTRQKIYKKDKNN